MAGLSLADADVLLLDEPTNHLDVEGIEWLESFMLSFKGASLFVSHDRAFLDRVATRIIEIDPGTGEAGEFRGTFSEYAAEKERRSAQEWAEYQRQQDEVRRMKQDVARMKQRAQQIEGAGHRFHSGHDHYNRVASKVARLGVTRERRLEKLLESDDRVDKPRQQWRIGVEFGPAERGGSVVARLEDVSVSFGAVRVLDRVSVELDNGDRVAVVGPNGTGKTTLLRLLMREIDPASGTVRIGSGVEPGYLPQQLEGLPGGLSPVALLRQRHELPESEARAFLHRFLFTSDTALSPVNTLSHGERVRLALALIVASGANLLLLDEPMNHLDMDSRQKLAEALATFDGTIVAATHDRAFASEFATRTWRLSLGQRGATLSVE
jgi:ATP-binding cassette subfamily F protein 3